MKQKYLFFTVLFLIFITCGSAQAKKLFLTAQDINKSIVDHTAIITEAPNKKTGAQVEYKAYFANTGAIRTIHSDGSTGSYNWISKANGEFCVRNNMKGTKNRASCGFIEDNGSGDYALYRVKKPKEKGGEVQYIKGKTFLLSITNLQKGIHLDN